MILDIIKKFILEVKMENYQDITDKVKMTQRGDILLDFICQDCGNYLTIISGDIEECEFCKTKYYISIKLMKSFNQNDL